MRHKRFLLILTIIAAVLMTGCGGDSGQQSDTTEVTTGSPAAAQDENAGKVASAEDMVEPEDVVEEGMEPIYGSSLIDGVYDVVVDSSSSMFHITSCQLTVADGQMTATMTMGGTGYLYVYMGTGEEAVAAGEDTYIPFVENADGAHTFTVPVEALDAGIHCTAFSKKKEMWYDRVLLFRADSLPLEAFGEDVVTNLELADGVYTVDVSLSGGSGKATVSSPATLTVTDGTIIAAIIWSSPNYDFMTVDGEKYLPVNTEGNSTFEIPVLGFDYNMPVTADTTAMSQPYEIEYTLYFDSSSVKPAE